MYRICKLDELPLGNNTAPDRATYTSPPGVCSATILTNDAFLINIPRENIDIALINIRDTFTRDGEKLIILSSTADLYYTHKAWMEAIEQVQHERQLLR